MFSFTKRAVAGVAAVAAATGGLFFAQASQAAVHPGQVVSVVPSLDAPQVRDGRVQALAQVGDTIIVGGTFTMISDAGGTAIPRNFLAAYDRNTHKLSRTFVPILDQQVWAATPGSAPNTVVVGGDFTTVNGVGASKVAVLDVTTGALVPGFKSPGFSSTVRTLGLAGGRLYVGGTFGKVNGVVHAGLAALNPTTGKLDPFVNNQFSGNHNYGVVPPSGSHPTVNKMPVGVVDLAIAPDGSQLTAIGNFRVVDGAVHDQIAQISLTGTAATVRADWTTSYFTAPCYYWAFDSWVRTVEYSPDGTYFVVGSTGGSNVDICDAVGRFETNSSGSNVQPTWIGSTGGDSIYAMAVTDSAIYAGGHFRWFNNPNAVDRAGAGAVPRPGVVALDPNTGIPLPWNPGRHPRDKGVFAMLVTDNEFILGSDTEWIGNKQYHTYRLASFPLAGGQLSPSTAITALPATLNRVVRIDSSNSGLEPHDVTTTSVGSAVTPVAPVAGLAKVTGATVVGGNLYLAMSDGTLHRRSYDGVTMGDDVLVDPYNDPVWSDVKTGLRNNTETYRGVPSGFQTDSATLTGMFYLNGKLYYTTKGNPFFSQPLKSRAFEPGSGILHPTAKTVSGVSLPAGSTSMTYADGYLFYVTSSGTLYQASFDGTTMGTATPLSGPFVDGQNWTSQALFISPTTSGSRLKGATTAGHGVTQHSMGLQRPVR